MAENVKLPGAQCQQRGFSRACIAWLFVAGGRMGKKTRKCMHSCICACAQACEAKENRPSVASLPSFPFHFVACFDGLTLRNRPCGFVQLSTQKHTNSLAVVASEGLYFRLLPP